MTFTSKRVLFLVRRWWLVFIPWLILVGAIIGYYIQENIRGAKKWHETKAFLVTNSVRLDEEDFFVSEVPGLPENFALTPLVRAGWDEGWDGYQEHYERLVQCEFPYRQLAERAESLKEWQFTFSNWRSGQPFQSDKFGAAANGSDWMGALDETSDQAVFARLNEMFDDQFAELDAAAQTASLAQMTCTFNTEDINYSPEDAKLLSPLASLLKTRGCRAVNIGKHREAVQSVESLLLLAETLSSRSSVVGVYRHIAFENSALSIIWEGLETGFWSQQELQKLIGRLAPNGLLDKGATAFEKEIDLVLYLANELEQQQIFEPALVRFMSASPLNYSRWLPDGIWDFNRSNLCLELWHQGINPLRTRNFRSFPKPINHGTPLSRPSEFYRYSKICITDLIHIHNTQDTCLKIAQAELYKSMARTSCAIELFKLQKRRLPDRLEELVPAYLPAIQVDWFAANNSPISYLVDHNLGSYRLYSVGADMIDQGGTVVWRRWKRKMRDGDWVWSIPMDKGYK